VIRRPRVELLPPTARRIFLWILACESAPTSDDEGFSRPPNTSRRPGSSCDVPRLDIRPPHWLCLAAARDPRNRGIIVGIYGAVCGCVYRQSGSGYCSVGARVCKLRYCSVFKSLVNTYMRMKERQRETKAREERAPQNSEKGNSSLERTGLYSVSLEISILLIWSLCALSVPQTDCTPSINVSHIKTSANTPCKFLANKISPLHQCLSHANTKQ
jgi:hypothetical protein